MVQFKHTAIYGTRINMKSEFISRLIKGDLPAYFPDLVGLKGVLYSNITLQKFIEEEEKHDAFKLSGNNHRSIRTYSSGEQKKALLEYLISHHPDFIIVDNPFDMLDQKSHETLRNRLIELSEHLPLIQIFKRREDILPCVERAIDIEGDKILFDGTLLEFLISGLAEGAITNLHEIPPPIEPLPLKDEVLIHFDKVNVVYEDRSILKNITWTIKKGEFWQLKGPNGSGKTTILTMINGDNPKAFGQNITLFGIKKGSGETVWQLKHYIGYFTLSMMDLFKGRHTAQHMIVSGIIDSIGLYRKATEHQMTRADQWLKVLGLYDKRNTIFIKLSQIEQRLVLIARAMVKHPPLLILDEPATGLDDAGVELMTRLINKIAQESDTAILYVSHRNEKGLNPQFIYELTPGANGSTGTILKV